MKFGRRAPRLRHAWRIALVAACIPSGAARGDTPSADAVDFARDIQPIFEQHCYSCHGPAKQESNYRLDLRAAALAAADFGEPPIVPGNAAESPLVEYIAGAADGMLMPPEGKGKQLTPEQVARVRAWIDAGAEWPDVHAGAAQMLKSEHWSLQPLAHVEVPETDDPFVANPIDAFILAKLQTSGLSPSPRAESRDLIRRLHLDLHGLLPTPEATQHFEQKSDAGAYAQLVEQLLASPHYGERWGRHWLDVVRFAETDGFEMNQPRPNAWHYRDYVIQALNEDKPYNRFVMEQLAGDALDADAATGFLVGGPHDKVVSPDPNLTMMQRQDELADMIHTTGSAFLGLTLGCARCHNHKFDPVLQKDYYALQAVFAGVKHGERAAAPSAAMMYAGQFTQPAETYRLHRGDPAARREAVAPDAIAALGTLNLSSETPEAERRLELARWIAADDNPLTARVIVNRLWHYHFGQGLVDTPSDFGANGGLPSHPELLDWLAGELIRHGWSLKHVHRLILCSNTYQQSSRPHAAGMQSDAGCRLLWRFPPRRLEAEAIRDCVLQTSGAINWARGGPGFSVFLPNENYVRVYEPRTTFGPTEWRRMVYMTKVRMEQDGAFGVFDCPDAGQVCPKRSRSTTALQALSLLNSDFMLQQSELWAARLEREAGATAALRIERAFQLAFGRAATENEMSRSKALVESHGLAALCRALFNSNEFLFIP